MDRKTTLSPWQQYTFDCKERGHVADANQAKVVQELQRIYDGLQEGQSWWRRSEAVHGLYVWGPVGTGKTYCMDLFYRSLPGARKKRMHFHAFMQMIQQQLRLHQGKKNPLHHIIKALAKQIDVLCFDEFLVNDIANAMILYGVLDAIFQAGITMVATSNIDPDRLYWDGLQRQQFLPAIDCIKHNMVVCACDPSRDYRQLGQASLPVYFTPLDDRAHEHLMHAFYDHAPGASIETSTITIENRPVEAVASADRVVWFDAMTLCRVPRGVADYLWMAKHYDVVIVGECPVLTTEPSSRVVNFMHLIDVLYDAKVKLIMSAAVPLTVLYTEGPLLQRWQRTQSRLHEMSHGVG